MGSPTKKRRAWSTLDEDADEQESAALAASLAAAKDTAARSDALLSSAKEDLSDHQRWLQAQSAAVERDRDRHERWLQRQKDLRAASAKKDRVRRHRRLVRYRALQALRDAVVDLFVFVRSWIAFGAGKVAASVRFVARSFAQGAVAVWRGLTGFAGSAFRHVAMGLSAVARVLAHAFTVAGRGLAQGARWTASKIGLAARGAGAGVAAGAAWSGSKASASVRAGSQALSAGSHAVAAEAGRLSRKTGDVMGKAGQAIGSGGRALGGGLASTGDSAAALAAATREGVASRASVAASKAAKLGATGARELSRAGAWTLSHVGAIPSKLFIHIARLGHEVQHFARVRTAAPSTAATTDRDTSPSSTATNESVSRTQNDAAQAHGHTASVHVFETYGPHPDGTTLFAQPANEPWTSDANPAADVSDGTGSETNGASGKDLAAAFAIAAGLGSGAASRMGGVVSSWGRYAKARAHSLGQSAGRQAAAGSGWLRKQTGQMQASARKGAVAIAQAQEGAFAQGAEWARKRGLDLSQMMIIAGAVLLVLGGLLIGGGFLLRSTSDPVVAAEPSDETFSKISWTFDQPERPLPERAIFTLSGTPQSFLINGISISGINNSDEPLTDLEAALSPDVKRPDLMLDVAVAPQDRDGAAPSSVATVPPGASFRLTFQFPPEAMGSADGISVEDFFESYGGLLLKLRYDADGAERSLIQYLDPEMLKAQLDEVSAEAGGS